MFVSPAWRGSWLLELKEHCPPHVSLLLCALLDESQLQWVSSAQVVGILAAFESGEDKDTGRNISLSQDNACVDTFVIRCLRQHTPAAKAPVTDTLLCTTTIFSSGGKNPASRTSRHKNSVINTAVKIYTL